MSRPFWFLVVLLLLSAFTPGAMSQDLARQPTAFTAWIDFQKTSKDAPIWIERVDAETVQADGTAGAGTTVYRVRFRKLAGLVDEVLMRVYFQDAAGAQPVMSGWNEIGTRVF